MLSVCTLRRVYDVLHVIHTALVPFCEMGQNM